MRTSFALLLFSACLLQASCSAIANRVPGVYSLDIQQGNMVDQEMINQLRPNMNKRQVLYIMGSPMLKDVFHQNRWDYLYSQQPGGEARVQKRISLFFDGDQLVGVQGDFRPSNIPVLMTSKDTTVDVPKRDLDKTLFEKITGIFSWDDDEAVEKEEETEESNDENGTSDEKAVDEETKEQDENKQDSVETGAAKDEEKVVTDEKTAEDAFESDVVDVEPLGEQREIPLEKLETEDEVD